MILIQNGTLLTMTDKTYEPGDILIEGTKIKKIAKHINLPEGDTTTIIDATGCIVTPGLIEAHCHLGISEAKMGKEGDDCNESTKPLTPWLRALDAINPMDAAFDDAVRAGITSAMIGPGSSNVAGGQFLFMKTKGDRVIDHLTMLAPAAMKVAFGENPKVAFGDQNVMPMTRMAIAGMLRQELFHAREYLRKKKQAEKDEQTFETDFCYESWIPVLERKIPLKAHVHRTDDILTAIRIAKEFDLKITLDHCTEGHLIAKEIADAGFPAIVGPDFASRDKIEVQNMAFKTAGILHKAGVLVAVTTDHPVSIIQSLPICAGFAAKCGLGKEEALKAITINAAKICQVDDRVGSLEEGKDADIAIFDGFPLEVSTRCLYTFINGRLEFNIYDEQNS
ncbi:MAG: amidohydrolase [Lachnospiraceae bacterium]|nr:amidohydrolase [Lachnospiraceae bacterium]